METINPRGSVYQITGYAPKEQRNRIAKRIVTEMQVLKVPVDQLVLPNTSPPTLITGDLAREHLAITQALHNQLGPEYPQALVTLDKNIADASKGFSMYV